MAEIIQRTGAVVVAAAGNDQSDGLFRVGSPAIAPDVTAVAAIENSRFFGRTLLAYPDPSQTAIPFTFSAGNPPPATADGLIKASEPINSTRTDDGCLPFTDGFFKGYIGKMTKDCIILIRFIQNVYDAGGRGVIFYNHHDGPIGDVQNPIPGFLVTTISGGDGQHLIDLLLQYGNGKVSVAFGQDDVVFPLPNSEQLTDFTSWGLGPDWFIKPDLAAPGGHIFSTYPVSMGKYAVLSGKLQNIFLNELGTSMASPHVAGLYALAMSMNNPGPSGRFNGGLFKTLLQTTAKPLINNTVSSVALQGSGLVNIDRVLSATTLIQPPSLAAGSTPWNQNGKPNPVSLTLSLKNFGSGAASYSFSYADATIVAADDPYNPQPYSLDDKLATVKFAPANLSLAAGSSDSVSVQIMGPSMQIVNAINGSYTSWIYSGFIYVDEIPSGNRYTISFGGAVGNFTLFDVFDVTENIPFLGTSNDNSTYNSTEVTSPTTPLFNITFVSKTRSRNFLPQATATGIDLPFIIPLPIFSDNPDKLQINLHFYLPSPQTIVYIFDANVAESDAVQASVTLFNNPQFSQPSTSNSDGHKNPAVEHPVQKFSRDHVIRDSQQRYQRDTPAALDSVAHPSAVIGPYQVPINDPDDTSDNLYSTLTWDGTIDMDSEDSIGVPEGVYRVVVVANSIYGTDASLSIWVSPAFGVQWE
ncbi:hypothetical protein HDU76_005549 [Blyttiomyces sp. JEL0837]|nr:hypothetical protein HDU76_005549 [Blyttiomyces sp. JEL0837]